MNKYKISLVSYINTYPFLYGLESNKYINENAELILEYPAESAKNVIDNKVDIGLVPVGALKNIENYNIISNYCLGTNREVKTVKLFSQVTLSEIDTILLDYQSATSVDLTKILSLKYWKINPSWKKTKLGYINDIKGKTAGLVIGDRVFDLENSFKYSYDLSLEWYNFTSLPFTFAVWITKKNIDDEFIIKFNEALKYGIENIELSINKYINMIYNIPSNKIFDYLTKNMNYDLDKSKQKSMSLYIDYQRNL